MDNTAPPKRVLLTYHNASYNYLVIYGCLFAISYGYIRLSRGTETGVPWYDKGMLLVLFCLFFLTIFEVFFLLNARMLHKRVEFDEANLYFTSNKKEIVVALGDVQSIIFRGSGVGSRGVFSRYEIFYGSPGKKAPGVYVHVYGKKAAAFEKLISLIQQQNPTATVKRYVAGIGSIVRLFKRKKVAA